MPLHGLSLAIYRQTGKSHYTAKPLPFLFGSPCTSLSDFNSNDRSIIDPLLLPLLLLFFFPFLMERWQFGRSPWNSDNDRAGRRCCYDLSMLEMIEFVTCLRRCSCITFARQAQLRCVCLASTSSFFWSCLAFSARLSPMRDYSSRS